MALLSLSHSLRSIKTIQLRPEKPCQWKCCQLQDYFHILYLSSQKALTPPPSFFSNYVLTRTFFPLLSEKDMFSLGQVNKSAKLPYWLLFLQQWNYMISNIQLCQHALILGYKLLGLLGNQKAREIMKIYVLDTLWLIVKSPRNISLIDSLCKEYMLLKSTRQCSVLRMNEWITLLWYMRWW